MALTALQLLTEAAAAEAKTWDATIAGGTSDLSEMEKFHLVTKVNEALRWWWKEHNRNWAWPETVDSSASVTVTSGLISLGSLGEGSWCLLATEDPRPAGNTASFLEAVRSEDGIHPVSEDYSTVFAFYRTACPQISYSSGSSYASPSNIPNVCLRPVVFYANAMRLISQGQYEAGYSRRKQAIELFEERMADLRNSGVVWDQPEALAIE